MLFLPYCPKEDAGGLVRPSPGQKLCIVMGALFTGGVDFFTRF